MLIINNSSYPDATAALVPTILGDLPETVLVLSLPLCDHVALLPLLDAEIVDEQARTISRYTPLICYEIADMDARTYAKLRLVSHTTTDNPTYYKVESDELLTLLGETVELEYQNAMEVINHV